MYSISVTNKTGDHAIFDGQDHLIVSGKITEGINKTGELSLTVPPTNENIGEISPLEGEIIVTDIDGVEIYRGRPTQANPDMYNTITYSCEGVMAYLLDTQYPPFLHTGTPSELLKKLLDYHNSRVSEKQKIYPGTVTVVDSNNYLRRESKEYMPILTIIQEKLIAAYGGQLQIRRVNGKNYLDYLAEPPVSDQVARLGENIIDLSQYIDASTVRTVIIPLGAEDDETGKRVDISSVNGGKNYIVDKALVEKFGWIEEVIIFDDVTLPENLLKRGNDYIDGCRHIKLTVDLTMVDCRMIGMDVRRVYPGMLVKVESDFHNLDTYFLCVSKETDLLNPENDRIVLGNEMATYTETSRKDSLAANEKFDSEIDKTESKLEDKILAEKAALEQQINEARKDFGDAIKNASGLYKTELEQDDGSTVIYYHDKPNLKDSLIQMTFNSAGFGLSADGGNTWYGMEVDGDMIANILNVQGINANWIRSGEINVSLLSAGKIRSKNFVEGESGTEIDLYTGDIRTMYINPYTGHHYSVKISESQIKFENHDTGFSVDMSASGFSIIDSEDGQALDIMSGTIQLSDYDASTGHVYGRVLVSKNGIQMEEGTNISVHDAEGYHTGKTGRAEFSDGTYIDFKNGIMVGGYTTEGGNIS